MQFEGNEFYNDYLKVVDKRNFLQSASTSYNPEMIIIIPIPPLTSSSNAAII